MKTYHAIAAAAATVMIGATFNVAAEVPPNYAAVLGSYIIPDSVRDDDDGYGGQLIFGAPISRIFAIELSAFGHELDNEVGNGSDTAYGVGIDLAAVKSLGPFGVFALGGFGGTYEDVREDEEVSPYVDAGVGATLGFTPSLGLRAEARYYGIFNDTTYDGESFIGDIRFGLGLQYAFLSPPEPIETPLPPPAIIPAAPAVIDSDGDGVPDGQDACPDTPKGFKVDEKGCVLAQVVVFHNILFEFDSDKLLPESEVVLRQISDGLKGQPALVVEVSGHTDWIGSDGYNLALSEKRARSVKRFLVAEGIAETRMNTVGYGEAQPIASNDTDAGRAQNRRVEFKVLQK